MGKPIPKTIGESLYWSYSNLAMRSAALNEGVARPQKVYFMIRSRLYKGLCEGTMKVQGYFDDERLKLTLPQACWYCGSRDRLSADHLIPQSKNGVHGGENLVYSCRHCNSSKGAKDFLEWMSQQGRFPPLHLLQRYLKMAVGYCQQHDLMDIPLSQAEEYKDTLPFSLEHIPHNFPKVAELCAFVQPTTEPSPETKAKMAAELGRGLSEALEQAAREHEDEESPDVS